MHAIYENHYLTDMDVANYARQSFAKLAENFTPAQNAKLIQFLARGMQSPDWANLIDQLINGLTRERAHELAVYLRSIPEHWVPFGHPHITLRMRAPVPITVQCYKHKIGFVESGESRRYITSRPEVFKPVALRSAAATAKQGSGDVHPDSDYWLARYTRATDEAICLYEKMVKEGICPEQARFVLPQGCELNWVWTGSLYAFANMYNLRTDPHSQKEIQDLAKVVGDIIAPLFPISWPALTAGNY